MLPILDRALELPPAERRAFLEEACADDSVLRAVIETVLHADEEAGGLLEAPTAAVLQEIQDQIELEATRTASTGEHVATEVVLERVLRRVLGERSRLGGPSSPSSPLPGGGRFLPGSLLARRYRIVSLLGQGGMGEVYRADDMKLGQAVALKFLPERLERDPASLERLLGEVRLARQVAHPNVCRVYDVGETEGRHFLSMEYVDGEDLSSLLKRIGRLPPEKALDIARQLCAGLGAAHREGILHRDLKPSNVMLDGRGRVRITDFGLAVLAEGPGGKESRAGTPAYMAPEQLEGGGATARSDVYALGLVLYEVFTGRRAFPGGSEAELRRLQAESQPASPSSLVAGLDTAVERAILRCLEKEPQDRPASGLSVAGALPGGDPLAAALAAGETPSPEMVAAAGPSGALNPRLAGSLLGVALALTFLVVFLSDQASILGWVPLDKSASSLVDNARDILRKLGYTDLPRDSAIDEFGSNWAYLDYVSNTDPSPGRWEVLRSGRFGFGLEYRQSLGHLVPEGPAGLVRTDDPPPAPGDVRVNLQSSGRLLYLQAECPLVDGTGAPFPPADWSVLFDVAGLDLSAFKPTPSVSRPPVYANERAAWSGVLEGGLPVRIEAAACRGRIVYFEHVIPNDPHWSNSGGSVGNTDMPRSRNLSWLLVGLTVLGGGAFLMVRNLRLSRGDRRGAFRLATAVFLLRFGWWVFGGHHVVGGGSATLGEFFLAGNALARALLAGAVMWCAYVGLEPDVRRRWPRMLVAWNRLLAGSFRDPLVGREVLIGAGAGLVMVLLFDRLYILIPHWLSQQNPPSPLRFPLTIFLEPPSFTLLGGRFAVAGFFSVALSALYMALFLAVLLLAYRLIFRRDALAAIAYVVLNGLIVWPSLWSGYSWIGLACGFLGVAVGAILLLRVGLVAQLSAIFVLALNTSFPVTANTSAPHYGIGLLAILATISLAAFGWTTSRGKRSVFLVGTARA